MKQPTCPRCASRTIEWDDEAREWRCLQGGHRVPNVPRPEVVRRQQAAEVRRRLEQRAAARREFQEGRELFDSRRAS